MNPMYNQSTRPFIIFVLCGVDRPVPTPYKALSRPELYPTSNRLH